MVGKRTRRSSGYLPLARLEEILAEPSGLDAVLRAYDFRILYAPDLTTFDAPLTPSP